MAYTDNEYHRLASDSGATLSEPDGSWEQPPQPKRPRRAKAWAMKLLTAVVTVATVFTVVTGRLPSRKTLADWPGFSASSSKFSYSSSALSKLGNTAQFAMGNTVYRISASGGDLCFLWTGSSGMQYEGSYQFASFHVTSLAEGWEFTLYIETEEDEKRDPDSAFGTISTTDGRIFYLTAVSHLRENDQAINSKEELSGFIRRFITYSRIEPGTDSGWGKVRIGETMYSDLYTHWNGVQYHFDNAVWEFDLNVAYDHKLTEADKVTSRTINGIDWTFYEKVSTVSGDTELMVWAVPAQESDLALGVTQQEMEYIRYNYVRPEPRGGVEDEDPNWTPPPITAAEIVEILASQLTCYHLITDGMYP